MLKTLIANNRFNYVIFFMQQDMRRYSVIFTHRLINPINTKPNATPKDYNGNTVNDLVK